MSSDLGDPAEPEFSLDAVRREGLLAPAGAEPVAHDGTGRVELSFTSRTGRRRRRRSRSGCLRA